MSILPQSIQSTRGIARGIGGLVFLIGAVVLYGWAHGTEELRAPLLHAVSMRPVTAAGLCLAGLAVVLSVGTGRVRGAGWVLFGLIALLGLLELVQALAGADLGIDRVLFPNAVLRVEETHPGRMSSITALDFLFVGAGSLLYQSQKRRTLLAGQFLVLIVILLCAHALFGYAYDFEPFHGLLGMTPVTLPTSAALGLLAIGCLSTRSDRAIGGVLANSWPSGTLLRRMLPVLLLVPFLVGWMALVGRRGGYFGPGFAGAITSTGSTVLMVAFLAWTLLNLRRSEKKLLLATQDLAASEQMFRASFENAFIGMAYLDASRKWTRVNSRFSGLLRSEPATLLGRPLLDVVHSEHKAVLEERLGALQEGRIDVYRGVERWIDSRGEVLWFDFRVTALRTAQDEFRHFIFILQDVTEAKRTAEQLRIQARSLEAAGSGIIITDARLPDHPIVYVNSAFERLSGYRRDDVLGQNCRFLNRLARNQPELDEVRHALGAGKPCTVVLQNHTKDGAPFWNELTLSPILDENGVVTHYLGIQSDITKLRSMASEREELLRTALEDRNRAVAATGARDVLLAVVSHELRSPLNAIRLWASLLHPDANPDAATLQKAVQRIENSVEAQSRLINDLLDASRIASGKLELELQRVDVRELAAEMLVEYRPVAEKGKVVLGLDCPERAIVVDGDRGRLKQVMCNLVENAIKFTHEGGRVDIAVVASEAEVVVQVRDTGIGIDSEQLPRLFDRFWQADRLAGSRRGGLGLGLHIVQHVVERHGGDVSVNSEGAGRGSMFAVRLPLVERQQGLPTGAPEHSVLPEVSAPGDVLVVDDEVDTAEVLALALRTRGVEVRVAYDGEAALEAIASRRPRVIVSDMMMPGLTGIDLLRRVREQEGDGTLSRIRAIAITGRGNPSDRWRARRAGFDVYMTKPVQVQELFKRVEEGFVQSVPMQRSRARVLVLGDSEELAKSLSQAGHEVRTVHEPGEVPRALAEFRPSVLLMDLDLIQDDVRRAVHDLRENHLSLFIIGMALMRRETSGDDVFDFVLGKPLQFEELRRLLRQAQDT